MRRGAVELKGEGKRELEFEAIIEQVDDFRVPPRLIV